MIEISPQVTPPVCKVLDYGKYKYELQKKKNEAKKNQKVVNIKELKLRPMIETHDYEVKLKQAKKFLEHGDKVKVVLTMRSRELDRREESKRSILEFIVALEDVSKIESLKDEKNRTIAILKSK